MSKTSHRLVVLTKEGDKMAKIIEDLDLSQKERLV
jgi:hypothetical protein